MSDSVNYGISGVQNITAQNIAVGPNSKIEQSSRSEPLDRPLAELARAIDAFEGSQGARDALIAAHAEVVEELEAAAPDKRRILSKLASVRDLAGPAVTVVQAAAVLTQAITTIL